MKNTLTVQYGSIYHGNYLIDNMAIILDKSSGLLKFGEKKKIEEHFELMISSYRKHNFDEIANDLALISFDRYDGILTVEEVCTFSNYMIMSSSNGDYIYNMLQMDIPKLKEKINYLAELGY